VLEHEGALWVPLRHSMPEKSRSADQPNIILYFGDGIRSPLLCSGA
jgi:hypothetical protein